MSTRPHSDAIRHWRASSFCNGGSCVEVALLSADTVGVRDNKNPDGPVIVFETSAWNAFLGRIKGTHQG
ncbi:DUF397 domain-containing protein [Nonomuraea bangladeshensis]|jgi:hypothetical protein|uniref:DUF397 domain-containing protein n=1 Tax=Nonomuraea bangladeshensis TaxID=404385 RepID=A0ABV3H2A7_9ACTN